MSMINGTSKTNLHNNRRGSNFPWWNSCTYAKKIMPIKANFYKRDRHRTNSNY